MLNSSIWGHYTFPPTTPKVHVQVERQLPRNQELMGGGSSAPKGGAVVERFELSHAWASRREAVAGHLLTFCCLCWKQIGLRTQKITQ